jgi:AcrR family transcriptional regulator
MSETAPMRLPLVGDPRSAGLPPAFRGPQNFDETKVRLILAGESLFAEQSIENVSLREIARAANNGNNNAVQYHFGGKEGLIQAIFAYRVWQMDKVRREGLARLESTGRDIDIQDLLDLLFLPLLDLADATGRHNYASVIVKYLLLSRPTGVPHAMDSLTESTAALREINSRIEGELAHLPADLVYNRITTASIMFNTMLVRSDNDGVTEAGGEQLRQRVGDCLEMIAAALLAPARAES